MSSKRVTKTHEAIGRVELLRTELLPRNDDESTTWYRSAKASAHYNLAIAALYTATAHLQLAAELEREEDGE